MGPYDMQWERTGAIEVLHEVWGDSASIEGGMPLVCVKGCMSHPPMFPAVWFLILAFRPNIFDVALCLPCRASRELQFFLSHVNIGF